MEQHIGVDLGSKASHVCRRALDGQILEERRVRTADLSEWLAKEPPARVVLETCAEAFTVADQIAASGQEPWVVPAGVVRQLGVGHRGVKNDVRDARVLSRASVALGEELPRVHVPSQQAREWQRLLSQRQGLVKARTQLVNAVRSQLRAELLPLRSGATESLPSRTRQALDSHPELLASVEPTLQAIETLTSSMKQLEAELKERTKGDPQIRQLKTVPGVGLLTAMAFLSAVDELERFKGAAELTSYLGLTPGENTTGGNKRLTGITKAGKAGVRTLLIQAAWTLTRVAPQTAIAQWFDELGQRRPKQVAIVAVARKMTCVMFAMMRDGQPFDPNKGLPRAASQADQRAEELSRALTQPSA